ncbi:phospholipase D-like domain-containing protein [Ornithinimicrobium sediminis]|uniref:phospholipase D-like domain-containing protein n=1 Tax=Ornithinimicrobium sediminis TaxID=2904603 RepID=UPI001E48514F|nr:phospholipase D-like domain-containing protein [Ornithinimicrobium sediminis]MCE0486353.1 phospholipase D-like domain-containing protein [Ornithinimicrobium sediminis]
MGHAWKSWVLRTGALAAGAPLGVAAVVTGVDAVRKRRTTEVHEAPDHPPRRAVVSGNALTTFTYGDHLYEAMLEAIEQAESHVYLASYIWKGDAVGQRFKDAVVAAADRGVQVCVVFDGFANLVVPREFKEFPPGVHLMKFPTLRPGLALVDVRRTGRDHRKVLVVDDRIGFVGGYNIGDLYATQWRDTHLQVEGEAVWELANTFVDFWNRHRRPGLPALHDSGSPRWDATIRAARNEPSRVVFPVRGVYLEAIDRASHHIWITQAYFIPDREIMHGLLSAAARGVDVRVLTPERSNHVVADAVARSYFADLLRGGVRIFLYCDAMVHAKTATVDGAWTTVGTANIDRLSLRGNYEVNLEILDAGQAEVMESIFRADLANSVEMTLEEWEDRDLVHRAVERVLRPLQPLL